MQIVGDLTKKKCVPCEGGVKPLTPDEYGAYLRNELSGWRDIDAVKIEKEYTFKDFQGALDFIVRVGQTAQEEGHNPDIYLHNWNKVLLTLRTHAIGGLSENYSVLASKIDKDYFKTRKTNIR